jgi:transcriptional regulator with XRE-family HTH domain
MNTARFLAALWERQRSEGLSNVALAERLGVHESTISRLKRGKRDLPHLNTVLGAIRAFPELGLLVTCELRPGKSIMRERKDEGV